MIILSNCLDQSNFSPNKDLKGYYSQKEVSHLNFV